MPTYKRPGVYTEESLTPLAQAAADPGEAAAAFVGVLPKGPIRPTRVASWSAYSALYGGFGDGKNLVPYAVYQYFNNGGRAAWIVRAVNANAVAATTTLQDRKTTPTNSLRVTAKSGGLWGNDLNISVVDANTAAGRFDLVVRAGGTTDANIVETWRDLSVDPSSGRYALSIVNSPYSGSGLIRLTDLTSGTYAATFAPALVSNSSLSGGTEGTGTPDISAAALSLEEETQDNLVVNVPGVSDPTVISPIVTWAESIGRAFVVVDLPAATDTATTAQTASAYLSTVAGLPQSSYVAAYGPWLRVDDPSSLVSGSVRLLPPGGAVLGQYSRIDASTGVQKPPAGVDTVLRGVLDVDTRFKAADLDAPVRQGHQRHPADPRRGHRHLGCSHPEERQPGPLHLRAPRAHPDQEGAARQHALRDLRAEQRGTVGPPGGVLTQYLTTLQQSGVLKGNTPEEAFYVKCDAENNTSATAQQGIVNIEVGVALSSPAEFVIIKIGQFEGGSAADELTEPPER
jgi:phage tail sheath protein FI